MNRKLPVLIVAIVFIGVALAAFIPLALGPLLDVDKTDNTNKDSNGRPHNENQTVRTADERNLPIPFNYYNPAPDSGYFGAAGSLDDYGDWEYPSAVRPHEFEIGQGLDAFQDPGTLRNVDNIQLPVPGYNNFLIGTEYGQQLPQPDAFAVGGAPTGGLTYGWGMPDNYASNATRTILLNYENHVDGIYDDWMPYRQIRTQAMGLLEPKPYGMDISVSDPPLDFIPVYSTLSSGSVAEYLGAHPVVQDGDCGTDDSGQNRNCHGYGNFVRIRNSRWAAVNASELYHDNNPTPCREGGQYDDPTLYDLDITIKQYGVPVIEHQPDPVSADLCNSSLLTDDKCEIQCTVKNKDTPPKEVYKDTAPLTNVPFAKEREICIVDPEPFMFRDGIITDIGAVKVTNYEVVEAFLTNGSVDTFFQPGGGDLAKPLTDESQIGTLGHSGYYWDEETGQYKPNTALPMLHYEVWHNENCMRFGDSPNTRMVPVDQTEVVASAVSPETQKQLPYDLLQRYLNTARAADEPPPPPGTLGNNTDPPILGAGDTPGGDVCPEDIWGADGSIGKKLQPIYTGPLTGFKAATADDIQVTIQGLILTREDGSGEMKDYPPRFLWKVVLSAAPKNDLTLSIRLSSTSGNGSTMTFPGHSQTIPKTPTAADGTITIGPVTDGAGPIEIWIDPTDPNKFADISFEIADSTEKDKIKTIAIPHAVMQGLWNTAINTYEALPGVSDTCLGFAAVDATPGTVGLWGVPLFTGLDCGALKTMNACKNPSQTFGVDETWMDEELGQKWLTADSDYYGGAYGKQQVHRYFAAVNACTGKEINMGVLNALWLKESIASNRYIPNGEMGALLTEGVTAMVKEYNEVTLPVEQLTDPTLKPIDLPDKFMISWTGDFGVNWTWQLLEDELPEVKTAILDLLKLFAKGYPDDPDNKIPAEFFIGPYDPQLGREAQYDTSQNGQAPQHTSAIDTAMAALSDLIFEKQYGWITDTEDFYFFRNEIPFGCDQAVADFFGKECDGALTNVTDRQIEVAIAAKFKTGYCNEPKALAQGAAYVENLAVVFSFLDTGCCFPASFTDTTCPASCGGGTPLPPTPVNCNNATDPCKDKKTGERCTLVGEEIKICTAPPDSPNPTECECKVIN